MRIITITNCFLALIISTSLFGQGAINNTELNQKLDSLFSSLNTNTPGVAVTVIQDGKTLSQKAYGMASIELQVPFTHQSVVRIGYSEAREFISIATVLMEKDGILSLTDKVRKYFPKLPEWSEPVTILDLLNHRSGFVDEWATLLMMHGSMSNRFDKEQFLRLLYMQPEPQIEPGKGYMYCNSDFGLLRLILEKSSGKNLSDWIKQRIFDPLKMNNTRMQKNAHDVVPNRANKYEHGGIDYTLENVQKTSPGGNYFILTCADDLEKWSSAISDPRAEFNAALETLFEKVRMIPGRKNHFVTGHTIDTIANHKIIIHEGVNGENYLSRIPSKGLTIITLANRYADMADQNSSLFNYLMNVEEPAFVKPVFAKKPVLVTEQELKKYEGKYRWLHQVSWESDNEIRKFSDLYLENGKLKMRYTGNYVIELIPVGKDVFYYEEDFGFELKFTEYKDNVPTIAVARFDDGFPAPTMEREMDADWFPTKDELKIFTGKYYSRHLDYYWNFELNEEGKLVLKRTTLADTILEPDGENQFHYIGEKYPDAGFDQWVRFKKYSQGKVTGLTVWSARVMHHRFEKKE